MGRLMTWLKRGVDILPGPMAQPLRNIYYRNKMPHLREEDEPDLAVLREMLQPGDNVVSIGANIGLYTRFLSKYVGPEGEVISFEPVPPTYKALIGGLKAMGVRNVKAHNMAVSDVNGSTVMVVPCHDEGNLNFYEAHIVEGSITESGRHRRFEVKMVRLDDFLGDYARPIALVKCDAEGHEFKCISGAVELLKRNRPMLFIELTHHHGELAANPTVELLAGLGYAAYYNDGEKLRRADGPAKAINFYFLNEAHRRKFAGMILDFME